LVACKTSKSRNEAVEEVVVDGIEAEAEDVEGE
jgi:hypothetical protein